MAKPKIPHLTVIGYGETGSGKTRWAATWPKVLFISTGIERGFDTVEGMKMHSPEAFYDPKNPPQNRYVFTAKENMEAWDEAEKLVKAGKVETIVQDSLSMYSLMYVDHLKVNKGLSGWDLYGALANHMQELVIAAQKIPCNILWMCQASDPSDAGADGGLFMEGKKTAKVLPPLVSNQLFFKSKEVVKKDAKGKADGKEIRHEIHTRKCGPYNAKVRINPNIPSPMLNSTYKQFVKALGYV